MLLKFRKIGDFYTGFGSGVSKQSFYFAEVDEKIKFLLEVELMMKRLKLFMLRCRILKKNVKI